MERRESGSVSARLAAYVEQSVFPRYASFDGAHREDHARGVTERALALAEFYPGLDRDILYAAAACHDLGLCAGRERHHLESGRIIRADRTLRELLGPEGLELAAQAAEDHRASSKQLPRSLYGCIVAEADRQIGPLTVLRRTIRFGLDHYPEAPVEAHWTRTVAHLEEKYGPGGYLHLFVPESDNAIRLAELRRLIADRATLRAEFDRIWAEENPLNAAEPLGKE